MKVYVLFYNHGYEGYTFEAVYSTLVGLLRDYPDAVASDAGGAGTDEGYFYLEEELQ